MYINRLHHDTLRNTKYEIHKKETFTKNKAVIIKRRHIVQIIIVVSHCNTMQRSLLPLPTSSESVRPQTARTATSLWMQWLLHQSQRNAAPAFIKLGLFQSIPHIGNYCEFEVGQTVKFVASLLDQSTGKVSLTTESNRSFWLTNMHHFSLLATATISRFEAKSSIRKQFWKPKPSSINGRMFCLLPNPVVHLNETTH